VCPTYLLPSDASSTTRKLCAHFQKIRKLDVILTSRTFYLFELNLICRVSLEGATSCPATFSLYYTCYLHDMFRHYNVISQILLGNCCPVLLFHYLVSCSHLLKLGPRSRIFYPEDGGDTLLRNVGSHKIYTAPENGILHNFLKPCYNYIQAVFFLTELIPFPIDAPCSRHPMVCDEIAHRHSVSTTRNCIIKRAP
jgi:hypothetical protein